MPYKDPEQRKAYQREYGRKWSKAHPERRHESQRKWREKHGEEYYQRHKKEIGERHHRWYLENKEWISERNKIHREKNHEKIRVYNKEYRMNHREQQRVKEHLHYKSLTEGWYGGIKTGQGQNYLKFARIVEDRIMAELPLLGFKEIFRGTHSFRFDALARKDGCLYAIEITFSHKKALVRERIDLARYLGVPYLVFHVRPNLEEFYICTVNTQKKSPTTYFYNGEKHPFGTQYTQGELVTQLLS